MGNEGEEVAGMEPYQPYGLLVTFKRPKKVTTVSGGTAFIQKVHVHWESFPPALVSRLDRGEPLSVASCREILEQVLQVRPEIDSLISERKRLPMPEKRRASEQAGKRRKGRLSDKKGRP